MIWLDWLVFFVSIALQVLVINSLLRGGAYKRYPFVFIYSLVLLLSILSEFPIFAGLVKVSKEYKSLYFYRNEAIRQFVLFAAVVSLIERAMDATSRRTRVRILLAMVGLGAVFVSLVAHSNARFFTLWMTEVFRDLSFGSVVLTLLLWSMLISSKKRTDRQLLMITGALGLQFTGEAIGNALRQMSYHRPIVLWVGNHILKVSHLIRLYIWWEAFRKPMVGPDELQKPGGEPKSLPHQAETLFQSNG